MTFGNPFWLALYDKQQREVTSPAAPARPIAHPPQAAISASQQDPGLAPLNTVTIRALHSTIRQLPRPVLEALTLSFRKRFSVPEEAATISDRIHQKCHHDWIEAFLVQQQGAA